MAWVGPLTGYLWRFNWFRLLSIKIAAHAPGKVANWWAVNTPLLLSLHKVFVEHEDWETAQKIVADMRANPGFWTVQ